MMGKSVILFSYYSNMPGACQAEWIDDRMFAIIDVGYDITIISATCCFTHTHPGIKHIKVPALSPHGARYEYEEIRRRNIPIKKGIVYAYLAMMTAVDKFFEKLHLRSGEGRWTWFLSSLIACLKIKNIRKAEFVFTTGGPASAHLTGIVLARLTGKKVMCEFQDPLSGKDIGRNKLSHAGLQFFEKQIIRFSDITIYCTQNAMEYARAKYARYAHKIFFVYPGSNKPETVLQRGLVKNESYGRINKINITYLGSLYQTRNLDRLMQAMEELIAEGMPVAEHIEINVYGNMNDDIRKRILAFKYPVIKIHGLVDRDIAMQKAFDADVLLLVQNTDDRSVGTIPFKTYDYLHTGKLILALLYRNNELADMMYQHGHLVCQADNVSGIKLNLLKLINDFESCKSLITESDLTPEKAVGQMLKLLQPA